MLDRAQCTDPPEGTTSRSEHNENPLGENYDLDLVSGGPANSRSDNYSGRHAPRRQFQEPQTRDQLVKKGKSLQDIPSQLRATVQPTKQWVTPLKHSLPDTQKMVTTEDHTPGPGQAHGDAPHQASGHASMVNSKAGSQTIDPLTSEINMIR